MIARRGAEVPLEEIARTAGLGIGTLYRHFPTRADLIDALAADLVEALAEQAEAERDAPRALDGLTAVLEQAVAHQERNLVLRAALVDRRGTSQVEEARLRWRTAVRTLVERARAEGDLRDDIGYADVVVCLWGLGRIVEATAERAPGAWRRQLAIALAGLGAPDLTIPGAPLSDAQLEAGALALHDRQRRPRGAAGTAAPPRRRV